MNIYRLKIKRNGQPIVSQVLDYISTWNGNPGLTEIGDYMSSSDMYYQIGTFTEFYFALDLNDDIENIYGLLLYENGMGDFIEGYIGDGDVIRKVF